MGIAAFILTATLLSVIQLVVDEPGMLLGERFLAGAGWLEAALLSVYAAWLARKLGDPASVPTWRPRIWRLFSVVFFTQLVLGLLGLERFLMTGELHLPVPALIAAGPAYRGEGFFMPVLFLATLMLVGPAWCSYLCYIGSWDDLAARRRKRPESLPAWRKRLRVAILVVIVGGAFVLRVLRAEAYVAVGLAAAFGIGGVIVMLAWSRRVGAMAHCATWCPIGLLADLLGKLSPFRLRIGSGCNDCGLCTRACRYDALSKSNIEKRRPGLTCTLCGDCLNKCNHEQIGYSFPGLSQERARALFVVMIVSLHAVFLGVARI